MDPSSKVKKVINGNFPDLFEKIKNVVEKNESSYDKEMKDSHLWEHTLNVASIALMLAEKEKADQLIVILTALFHDSGKFAGGEYHNDDIPEESKSSEIAENIMYDFKVTDNVVDAVINSLNSLYMEGSAKNKISDIVHDADFLSKSGPLGIGEFFIKGALRGENLINRIINSATKELTYSENMTSNMRTGSGKVMAGKDRSFTRKFFRVLFDDLKKKGITDLLISEKNIESEKCKKKIRIVTVSEKACGNCGSKPEFQTSFESGIKCEKLILKLMCPKCKKQIRETSFCLPEICKDD